MNNTVPLKNEYKNIPAFPTQELNSNYGTHPMQDGMTLRDYFAGQIKPAIITGLMLRYKDTGYSDEYMLDEADRLTQKEVNKMLRDRK